MADPALTAFVKESLTAGRSRDEIAAALKAAGWREDQAKDALSAYADIDFAVPVPRPRRYGSAREAFLYIVYFLLLGVVAGHIGAVGFAFIDFSFADPLERAAASSRAAGLRWAIAGLLVGYPIFVALGWRLGARRRRDPARRDSRVRAWLTYVTLIFAAGALIGDLIAVVYQFLSGDLGARFLAKAGLVGAISGAILFNFARDAERADSRIDWPGRALALLATGLVVFLVVWGFTIVKSPADARARLMDERRIEDIGALARLVDCHVRHLGGAPETLDDMRAALDNYVAEGAVAPGCASDVPYDPATGAPYRYERGETGYRLCAVFEAGWPEAGERGEPRRRALSYARSGETQRHIDLPRTGGETCFSFAFEATESRP